MAYNDPCSNVQSEFGVGCYRSGDIFFLYCTPYSNQLLNERCNGNVSPDSGNGNSECHRRCEREAERCHRRCCREQVSPESGCGCRCRCNCRGNSGNNTNNTASVGGDSGNCYY